MIRKFEILALLFMTLKGTGQDVHITPPVVPTTPTVTVLERVVPRACMVSVQMEDPAKCHVESIELAPDSECRGPVGEPLQCSKFAIKLNKECHYVVTKRVDCENINVKKVPAVQQSSSREEPSTTSE